MANPGKVARMSRQEPEEVTFVPVEEIGGPVAAVVGRDNLLGTQFHPEKSQRFGLAFLTAFFGWRP